MNDYPYRGPSEARLKDYRRDVALITARARRCASEHPDKDRVLGCVCGGPTERALAAAYRICYRQGV